MVLYLNLHYKFVKRYILQFGAAIQIGHMLTQQLFATT